jgi:hypothetical protein
MKKQVVEAYNGIGKEKKLAGQREVDMPETIDEATKLWGEEDFLDYAKSSYVIEIQRQIRAGTTMTAKQQLAAIQAYARANPESDVAKTLAALKIGVEGEAKEAPAPSEVKEEAAKSTPKKR